MGLLLGVSVLTETIAAVFLGVFALVGRYPPPPSALLTLVPALAKERVLHLSPGLYWEAARRPLFEAVVLIDRLLPAPRLDAMILVRGLLATIPVEVFVLIESRIATAGREEDVVLRHIETTIFDPANVFLSTHE